MSNFALRASLLHRSMRGYDRNAASQLTGCRSGIWSFAVREYGHLASGIWSFAVRGYGHLASGDMAICRPGIWPFAVRGYGHLTSGNMVICR
ncbi:hypothetical protein, partial [uncultured Duncaniella sp.]|uniref:hypothetical protein n=1 Tax=uncultured Duncaniella sp. TaxID=2768039 RepID=UPI00263A869D